MTRVQAGDLFRRAPGLVCTDCEKEVAEAPPAELWVLHGGLYRCSECAIREGLY